MEINKLTSERKKKIKTLIKLMNSQNERNFPAVLPLIEAMNLVLTPEELDYLVCIGTGIYTYSQASAASTLAGERFEMMFESLKGKGFIKTEYDDSDNEAYTLNPIIVGWIEGQVPFLKDKPEEAEFAKKFQGEYLGFAKKFNFFPFRNIMNAVLRPTFTANQSVGLNTIPVKSKKGDKIDISRQVPVNDSKIFPMKSINDMVLEYSKKNEIAQFNCMCRRLTEKLDDPCRLKIPDNLGCIGFGNMIRPYVKYGHARFISVSETIDVIQMAREHGAIHTVYHKRDDAYLPEMGFCNCCWDCCGFFRGYNQGSTPLKYRCFFNAGFKDTLKCTGCGKCAKFCPTAAIKVKGKGKDKKAVLDTKKCLGCGQCVYQCPQNILELVRNEREVFLPIIKKSEARIQG